MVEKMNLTMNQEQTIKIIDYSFFKVALCDTRCCGQDPYNVDADFSIIINQSEKEPTVTVKKIVTQINNIHLDKLVEGYDIVGDKDNVTFTNIPEKEVDWCVRKIIKGMVKKLC